MHRSDGTISLPHLLCLWICSSVTCDQQCHWAVHAALQSSSNTRNTPLRQTFPSSVLLPDFVIFTQKAVHHPLCNHTARSCLLGFFHPAVPNSLGIAVPFGVQTRASITASQFHWTNSLDPELYFWSDHPGSPNQHSANSTAALP